MRKEASKSWRYNEEETEPEEPVNTLRRSGKVETRRVKYTADDAREDIGSFRAGGDFRLAATANGVAVKPPKNPLKCASQPQQGILVCDEGRNEEYYVATFEIMATEAGLIQTEHWLRYVERYQRRHAEVHTIMCLHICHQLQIYFAGCIALMDLAMGVYTVLDGLYRYSPTIRGSLKAAFVLLKNVDRALL